LDNIKISYSPYTGGIYDGDVSAEDMRYEDAFIGHKIAELTQEVSPQLVAAADQELGARPVNVKKYGIMLSASLQETAKDMAVDRAAKKMLWAGATPEQKMQASQALLRRRQLTADIDTNVSHIRVIPRIPKILGVPPSIYFLENMFTSQPVEKLDARVAEQDGISTELQKLPTERVTPDKTRYTEHRFELKRNSIGLVWSSESQIRADAPIKEIDYRNAALAKTRARELLALLEFSKLEADAKLVINDVKEKDADVAIPRSKNNPVEDLATITANFNTERSANLTHLAWNPIDFVTFASNYYTMTTAFTGPAYQGYGVVAMPKMPQLTAVISPFVPRGYVYAVDKNQVFKGEGPVVMEQERDAQIYSDRAYLHDFVQFLIPNRKRFGLKILFGDKAIRDAGQGEIDSLAKAQALAGPKAELATETYKDGNFK